MTSGIFTPPNPRNDSPPVSASTAATTPSAKLITSNDAMLGRMCRRMIAGGGDTPQILCCGDVVALPDGHRQRVDHAREHHPPECDEHDDQPPPVATGAVRDQGEDEERGHHEQQVDDTQDDALYPTAEIGRDPAEERGDRGRPDRHGQRDRQRALESVHHLRIQVVAGVVGAEPVGALCSLRRRGGSRWPGNRCRCRCRR